jgi:hypothetical protein
MSYVVTILAQETVSLLIRLRLIGQDWDEETNRWHYVEDVVCSAPLTLPGACIDSIFLVALGIVLLALGFRQYS